MAVSDNIYSGRYPDQSTIQLTDSARVLRDVITRAYGCHLLSLDGTNEPKQESPTVHPNLLHCKFTLETSSYFILVYVSILLMETMHFSLLP